MRRYIIPALLLLAAPLPAEEPLTKRERVNHFLNRFTLGATPALAAEVEKVGIRAWLDQQLAGGAAPAPELTQRLVKLESLEMTNGQILGRYVKPLPPEATQRQRQARNRLRNVPRRELKDSVLVYGVHNPNQVQEAVADFWRNHFTVAVDKVRYFGTEYEREVIRARVFGSFGAILRASAQHPAMLQYLDNAVSRRPPTKAELKKIEMRVRLQTKSKERGQEASNIAAQRGLNENYARELLELHTLGVDSYYTQRDVESVAAILTGWTFSRGAADAVIFEFRPEMHQRGSKHFLGRMIAENRKQPVAEGEKVLKILTAHKGTARFIAWKLCRWFVHDEPDEAMVARIAKVFQTSRGDLKALYRAIVDDPGFFAPKNYRAKFKRPYEFVVSALRATGAQVVHCNGLHRALAAMSEPVYECKDPTGYYDQAEAWRDPGAFAVRWKFAMDLATGKVPGVRIPETLYEDFALWWPRKWKDKIVERILPVPLGPRTDGALEKMIARYLEQNPNPVVKDLAPRIVGMILGSPEFQEQ